MKKNKKKFLALHFSNKNFFFTSFDDKNRILRFLWLKMWLKNENLPEIFIQRDFFLALL